MKGGKNCKVVSPQPPRQKKENLLHQYAGVTYPNSHFFHFCLFEYVVIFKPFYFPSSFCLPSFRLFFLSHLSPSSLPFLSNFPLSDLEKEKKGKIIGKKECAKQDI
jgi:hypothetical protein